MIYHTQTRKVHQNTDYTEMTSEMQDKDTEN